MGWLIVIGVILSVLILDEVMLFLKEPFLSTEEPLKERAVVLSKYSLSPHPTMMISHYGPAMYYPIDREQNLAESQKMIKFRTLSGEIKTFESSTLYFSLKENQEVTLETIVITKLVQSLFRVREYKEERLVDVKK